MNNLLIVVEVVSAANNVIFLRFLELFWITPVFQHKAAFATFDSFWEDFWSCLRIFPKHKEGKKGNQVKEYKKDRVNIYINIMQSFQI